MGGGSGQPPIDTAAGHFSIIENNERARFTRKEARKKAKKFLSKTNEYPLLKRYGETRNAILLNIAHFSSKLEKHAEYLIMGMVGRGLKWVGGNLPLPPPQGWIGHKSV